ncbi:hypothetical protein KIM372_14140 [Bombiscardovia nodaiensis]|uniref:Uncharacterized protein n=1 Tax=Bombiscardovia nodaiensis TaxID=2932181 RepID=A0ABM8B9F5_9BIFI|nr:hypothetical protein KIM372_14140 [Bombiscardovia nodaiensis]
MNETLSGASLSARENMNRELDSFEAEINRSIGHGAMDQVMVIHDEEGGYPVVVALGKEPLVLLVERITAIGGLANVFVKEDARVTYLSVRPVASWQAESTSGERVLDLSEGSEWTSGNAEISMLLDALREYEYKGAALPIRLPNALPDLCINERQVELAAV